MFGSFAGGFLIILSMVVDNSSHIGGVVASVPLLCFSLFVCVRAVRCASIQWDQSGLIVRSLWRTKRVQWEEVRSVEVGPGTSAALIPWRVPCLVLKDGSTICADEIRSLRSGGVVQEIVEEIDREIEFDRG